MIVVNRFGINGTLLCIAAENGHQPIVEFLVQSGANINKEDKYRKTPLFVAVEKGYQSIVKFLVKSGANIHNQTVEKETPYTIAQKYQYKEIIEYFDKLKNWVPGIIKYFTTNWHYFFITANHKLFPKKIQIEIKTLMMINSKSSTILSKIPKDILFSVCQLIAKDI